jgi:SAM-dependent methyltransferase
MFKLTPTPIANSFPLSPDRGAKRFPLEVMECLDCGHVQLAHQISVDWDDYRYSTPEASRPHLYKAALSIKQRYPHAVDVLEVGSNNGLYLQELRKVGFSATGVDPCATDGIAKRFTEGLALTLPKYDIVVANNVLAHVDDLQDTLKGIDCVLKDDGALVFEVQYLPSMMASGSFDMIYHEHRDYHTLGPLRQLKRYGFVVKHYEYLSTHGGSIRVFCERPGIGIELPTEVFDWRLFSRRIEEARQQLTGVCGAFTKIAAFGATAKATTLIHHFGLQDKIAYCVDNTPAKQGRYIPGTGIKIYPEERLKDDPPEAVLLTAWNFANQIRPRFPGVKFILPFEPALQEAA